MLVLKLSVIDTGSWWCVVLPIGPFIGLSVTYIVVAFIYLLLAHIPEKPDENEVKILEPHTINVYYLAAMLFFIDFDDNLFRRIEGSDTSYWFWLISGQG